MFLFQFKTLLKQNTIKKVMLSDQEHLENIEEVFENFQSYFFKEIISKNWRATWSIYDKKILFLFEKIWISRDFIHSFIEQKFQEIIKEGSKEKEKFLDELNRKNNFFSKKISSLEKEIEGLKQMLGKYASIKKDKNLHDKDILKATEKIKIIDGLTREKFSELENVIAKKEENLSKIKNVDNLLLEQGSHKYKNLKKQDLYNVVSVAKKFAELNTNKKKEVLNETEIKNLYHFTPLKNLKSILQDGILPRSYLEDNDLEFAHTDPLRIDRRKDFISSSISHPNYKYLWNSFKEINIVIIEINPNIILETSCIFCPTNSAANSPYKKGKNIPHDYNIESNYLWEAMRGLPEIRSQLDLPNNFPTDPQAEILIYKKIPLNFIKRIIFFNERNLEPFKNSSLLEDINIQILASKDFYDPRADQDFWKNGTNFHNASDN